MATSSRFLCILLTLGMVVSRPSATVHPDSSASGWWGTKASKHLQDSIREQVGAGNYASVEALFKRCGVEASRYGDPIARARCLTGLAVTLMARSDFQDALAAYLQARELVVAAGDQVDLGAIDVNLSTLYLQMFDFESALRTIDEAQAAAARVPKGAYYRPQLLMQSGRLHAEIHDSDWESRLVEAIEAARTDADPKSNFIAVEAQGWDLLGEQRLAHGDLEGSEQAQTHAFFLRRLSVPRDLGYSYMRFGDLRLAQAERAQDQSVRNALLQEADRFTTKALAEQARGLITLPADLLPYQRGRIFLAQGRTRAALESLEAAVNQAERWRAGVPRALSTLAGATAGLEEGIFRTFIETAVAYGVEHGEARWVEEGFEAAELNRAPSLKDSQALANVWREKMPGEFWEILGKLRNEDTRLLRAGLKDSPLWHRLNMQITEMEAKAGLGLSLSKTESFPSGSSLTLFRARLRDSEMLLSFHLGERSSFLWAATRMNLNVYSLPPRERIRELIEEFRTALESGRPESETRAEQLYSMLFARLRPEEAGKAEWLLSLDDALFDLPFAALIPGRFPKQTPNQRSGDVVYLVEQHSLQVVPGALLYSESAGRDSPQSDGRFVAVADPIYNVADPRWDGRNAALTDRFHVWLTGPDHSGQFNRLPGSRREAKASAQSWASAGTGDQTESSDRISPRDSPVVLEGRTASKDDFLRSLSSGSPSVIHLATHVITRPESPDRAFVAFSLGPLARSEVLATSDVAMLHVPGSLVVMTGCTTGDGKPLPGEGLAGLSRAWSIAGAGAVLVTQWPVGDSTGEFFPNFYRHLRNSTPAEALRFSQLEMIHGAPVPHSSASWAGYEIFRGAP